MKILHRIIIFLISITALAGSLHAQRARDNKIYLDLSGANICGLDSTEFSQYYANTYNSNHNQVDLIFKRFLSKFSKKFNEETKDVLRKNDLVGILSIKEITDQAGILGRLFIWRNGIWDKYTSATINVPDGRWNSFEELLYENGEIGAEQAAKIILLQIKNKPLYGQNDNLLKNNLTINESHKNEFQLKYTLKSNHNKDSIEEITKYFLTIEEAISYLEAIENEFSSENILNCEITEIK